MLTAPTRDEVTAETVTDDDIVRYWTIFAYDDAGVTEGIAGCEYATETLARAAIAAEGNPQTAAAAFRMMLGAARISEDTFREGLAHSPLSDGERRALLENPHVGAYIATHWDTLSDDDKAAALENPCADPQLIARELHRNPYGVLVNPAAPTEALLALAEMHRHLGTFADGTPNSVQLTGHPNAPEAWHKHRPVPAVELADLDELPDTTGAHRRVEDLGAERIHLDVIGHLRELTSDEVTAATAMVRAGFDGTAGELLEVARTFH